MKDGEIFGRYIVVKSGKELNPQELAEFEEIAKQVGDDFGEWISISFPLKPEGSKALRRETSEITDYLFVQHPKKDDIQIFEGYYVSTVGDTDEIIRYEILRFPAWFPGEIYTT